MPDAVCVMEIVLPSNVRHPSANGDTSAWSVFAGESCTTSLSATRFDDRFKLLLHVLRGLLRSLGAPQGCIELLRHRV